jgi:hypothetical protein
LLGSRTAAEPIVTLHGSDHGISGVDAVRLADGSTAVAWLANDTGDPIFGTRVVYRRFSSTGVPAGEIVEVHGPSFTLTSVRLLPGPERSLLVLVASRFGALLSSQLLQARLYDGEDSPVTPLEDVHGGGGYGSGMAFDATTLPDGSFLVFGSLYEGALGSGDPTHTLWSRRIEIPGGPVGEGATILRSSIGPPELRAGGIAASGGQILAAFTEGAYESLPLPVDTLWVRPLDASGGFAGAAISVPVSAGVDLTLERLRGTGSAEFVLAWTERPSDGSEGGHSFSSTISNDVVLPVVARPSANFDVDRVGRAQFSWVAGDPAAESTWHQALTLGGTALSEPALLDTEWRAPSVFVGDDGAWSLAWSGSSPEAPHNRIFAKLGSFANGCENESSALCLSGNRFRVAARYHDHLGREGAGQATPLTADSGTFWFFAPANVELIVKVVDACTHPAFQNFWVFASGLTDVAVTLTVVDTWSGESWERSTALGEPFPPILDTQAFSTCGTTAPIVSLATSG